MKLSPLASLKFRDFKLFFIGLLISRIGSEMQVVAINWQVYLQTKSALSLGFIGLSRFIPVILFSLIAGVASDKFDKRKLMGAAQVVMMSVSIVLAVTTLSGQINPMLIYILIAIHSTATIFDTPARQSIAPELVPTDYFMNAVSLNTVMWQTAMVAGPAIAGFVIAYLGVGTIYWANAVSFLAVIVALILMKNKSNAKIPIVISKERKRLRNLVPKVRFARFLAFGSKRQAKINDVNFDMKSIIEGLNFVRKTPIIYSTMLLDFFATFFASATVLLPVFAKDILSVGPAGMGFLYAAPSLGAVTAGIIVSALGHLKNQGKILLFAVILYGLATVLFGISKSFYLSLIFLFAAGVGDVISTIIRNTIRQLATPVHLRGRMVSVNMIFFMGGPQLGEAEAGIAAAALGGPLSVVAGGAGTILATFILVYLVPDILKYRGDEVLVG